MNEKLEPWMDRKTLAWALLFLSIVLGYCLYYAPYGLNETDGGFLTGLAWQLLNGKVLYQDVLYVRPPLPVWLRVLELQCLPESMAILGERWIFYAKIAVYSVLGANILSTGNKKWLLAIFGFVVSVHCYPAMAWHTVDGILFAVIAVSLLRGGHLSVFLSGAALLAALLCKQSFYPLILFFLLFWGLEFRGRTRQLVCFFTGFVLSAGLFWMYLVENQLLASFIKMTNGAASGGQALQHGLLDYFRITPELAVPGLVLLSLVFWWSRKIGKQQLALRTWLLLLLALILSFAGITWLRQEHTVPFAQSRFMFWIAGVWLLEPVWRFKSIQAINKNLMLLLGISWCAAVSWGYNLPILFATPLVWVAIDITQKLQGSTEVVGKWKPYWMVFLAGLLLSFRAGYEFVYRDGRRSEMQEPMGTIFPQLSGIYSDRETAELYRELKQLSETWGPDFKTLPAFPQSNFLTQTVPPLPLDWVVNRETNGDTTLIYKALLEKRPVFFVQKSFEAKIKTDPQLELTKKVRTEGKIVAETPNFWVIRLSD